jgi:hypothetical protein
LRAATREARRFIGHAKPREPKEHRACSQATLMDGKRKMPPARAIALPTRGPAQDCILHCTAFAHELKSSVPRPIWANNPIFFFD